MCVGNAADKHHNSNTNEDAIMIRIRGTLKKTQSLTSVPLGVPPLPGQGCRVRGKPTCRRRSGCEVLRGRAKKIQEEEAGGEEDCLEPRAGAYEVPKEGAWGSWCEKHR